jgi:hypothetical protein
MVSRRYERASLTEFSNLAHRASMRALIAVGVSPVMLVSAMARANDLNGIDGDIGGLGQDRTDELGILADMVVTGARFMEDFIGPLMGVGLLLGAVNMGARHGDLMGGLRYAMGGIFCFGIPYLIDLAITFGG